MARIESLLSARSFLAPQMVQDRIYFISNLSGHLSLYAMDFSGSVPEPLLPPGIALQNPHLIEGLAYQVFPGLDMILVMIDSDGNEVYKPMLIPMEGGYPEPVYQEQFSDFRVQLLSADLDGNVAYFSAESMLEPMNEGFQAHIQNRELTSLAESKWGAYVVGASSDHMQAVILDAYTAGDHVGYLWNKNEPDLKVIFGIPMDERQEDQDVPINNIIETYFTPGDGLLFTTSFHHDDYGLGYLSLSKTHAIEDVEIRGIVHSGIGELESIRHTTGDRYVIQYNIEGCSWLYEGIFNEIEKVMQIQAVICGQGFLSEGVVEEYYYDKFSDRYVLSFSSATTPTQIYTVSGDDREIIHQHTRERILGLDAECLSVGEDASYTSFDGTRISARLYLPSPSLRVEPPYPLVYYIHGGPQGQERPDFSWFSMPLIQLLSMKGFAVFVPNVRGSTGYGLSYMKEVDRDWGGKDRLDHVFAMEEFLPGDRRLDVSRSGVVGRSYGGYMTLILASRHPELWSAAVDMFGPYDLLTFLERIPETWKPYFSIALGDPVDDREFLLERSPNTYISSISSPLLVIQGKNDPRVVERESRELVDQLISEGKQIDYLMFENEGHDVLKYQNRVECYNRIVDFFSEYLGSDK